MFAQLVSDTLRMGIPACPQSLPHGGYSFPPFFPSSALLKPHGYHSSASEHLAPLPFPFICVMFVSLFSEFLSVYATPHPQP